MDLSTTYMGLKLENPLMPGASPICDDLDMVKRMEDAGAGAIVMHSLFEEQIAGEQLASIYLMETYADSYAEAMSYFPKSDEYRLGPDQYLEQIRKIKQAVKIPVIGSLNGTTPGGWLEYASMIEQAGADALELNVYHIATDTNETSTEVENRVIDIVEGVRKVISIPIAVKLSPYFSSLANLVSRIDQAGANAAVVFNRFYQPDIDIANQEVMSTLKLSDSGELLLRLRWMAILHQRTRLDLACSGGVHTPVDAIKAVMAGASAVQLVSVLLRHGPEALKAIRQGIADELQKLEYHSVKQIHGSMSLSRCPDPRAFERANYMRILQSWRPDLDLRGNSALQL